MFSILNYAHEFPIIYITSSSMFWTADKIRCVRFFIFDIPLFTIYLFNLEHPVKDNNFKFLNYDKWIPVINIWPSITKF